MRKSIKHWWWYGWLPNEIRKYYWRYRWCLWKGHYMMPADASVGIFYASCEICGWVDKHSYSIAGMDSHISTKVF